ncbi:hypothetical protein AN639_08345 [Candidatus Epulonipiscium fishelsonii]|uniref:Uncharacterized protein n=1 Tax=Candidatus Epulonipiscium fishelsonii TaxID=77094 RepID=A0ACC8XGU4_9FIRM|nr:hypothetical protein AN639_08345 [Epulopiscium sp. SCG-B05WGA-EpuloA1]ONI42928.1 hypothetical protein AN396_12900 [Epulopiscium sp. SCG-B11WGA-EpuloA1]
MAFYDGNTFIGLTYLISTAYKVYILYLAMDTNVRSKGYGSHVLDIIKQRYNDKTVFLSIEEVSEKYKDFSIRKRRLEFYLKNGFVKNDYSLKELGQLLETMSFNGLADKDDFIDTFTILAKPLPKFVIKQLIK